MGSSSPSAATLYDRVAELPVVIEEYELQRRERETSSEFTRVSTVVSLHGEGETGKGEDVTYETADHERFLGGPRLDVAGEHTIDSVSATLGDTDLFPAAPPAQEKFREYRRWAFESAALDLALRQAGRSLSAVLGRERRPVSFVGSTRLGDPPTVDRVESMAARVPDLGFKLDPTPDWPESLIETLADMDVVRILDCKAYYEDAAVGVPADADWYATLLSAFPDAIVEDPGVTTETRELLSAERGRLSWDEPIDSLAALEELPWAPRWLNVKPSRFGSIESLFETIEYALEQEIQLYGGGQFELDVGRGQIQLLASVFYPDGPNDVAPGTFNVPDLPASLPSSPLDPPPAKPGFRW